MSNLMQSEGDVSGIFILRGLPLFAYGC